MTKNLSKIFEIENSRKFSKSKFIENSQNTISKKFVNRISKQVLITISKIIIIRILIVAAPVQKFGDN